MSLAGSGTAIELKNWSVQRLSVEELRISGNS